MAFRIYKIKLKSNSQCVFVFAMCLYLLEMIFEKEEEMFLCSMI